ncbi:hypothetical protein BDN72DRAFT_906478 [Pluteus cervinus]|uniref:Uncharacterized protein n=1 Tax=Pluteus cervinus TaxID=181527 RepID=A0ACD2ZZ32_9AGAR|nr:hypothetical protein BDN72DRAFT_906478 [Pluteus cervinus]
MGPQRKDNTTGSPPPGTGLGVPLARRSRTPYTGPQKNKETTRKPPQLPRRGRVKRAASAPDLAGGTNGGSATDSQIDTIMEVDEPLISSGAESQPYLSIRFEHYQPPPQPLLSAKKISKNPTVVPVSSGQGPGSDLNIGSNVAQPPLTTGFRRAATVAAASTLISHQNHHPNPSSQKGKEREHHPPSSSAAQPIHDPSSVRSEPSTRVSSNHTSFHLTHISNSMKAMAEYNDRQLSRLQLQMKAAENCQALTLTSIQGINLLLQRQNDSQRQILDALCRAAPATTVVQQPANRKSLPASNAAEANTPTRKGPEQPKPKHPLHDQYNRRIQEHIAFLLGCDRKEVANVKRQVSPDTIKAVVSGAAVPPLNNWCLEWDAAPLSPYNRVAIHVAACDFVRRADSNAWKGTLPPYARDLEIVMQSMYNHVSHILRTRKEATGYDAAKKVLESGLSSTPESSTTSPADFFTEHLRKLKKRSRNQRKQTLAMQRKKLVQSVDLLKHHAPMMEELGIDAASSDESDQETSLNRLKNQQQRTKALTAGQLGPDSDANSYTVIQPAWRSFELSHFLWCIDQLRQESHFITDGHTVRNSSGNQPHIRIRSGQIHEKTPPKGLPCNFYDNDWLSRMNPLSQRLALGKVRDVYDLIVPDELLGGRADNDGDSENENA